MEAARAAAASETEARKAEAKWALERKKEDEKQAWEAKIQALRRQKKQDAWS